ncbi:uncharacterized protein BDR25DRAFT_201031, partial [Lindgomyces ingoldianus]
RGGASTRGKRATAQPTFKGRRSKEEREQRVQADLARDRQRMKEREAEAKKAGAQPKKEKEKEGRRNANAHGRGGGFTGADLDSPFSWSARKKASGNQAARFASGFGSGLGSGFGSGPGATRVKREPNNDGGYMSLGIPVKKEDGGYVSSGEEDDVKYPRKDIDTIQISSDEDEVSQSVTKGNKGKGTAPQLLMPVRVNRKEHHDRVVGINTEASSATSTKSLQQVEAPGESRQAETAESVSRKGKGKMKDVEITDVRRPYKGMWQDADEPHISVKTETISDEENSPEAVDVRTGTSVKAAERQSRTSPSVERRPQAKGSIAGELVHQTDEDRAEWERGQAKRRYMLLELGPGEVPAPKGKEDNGQTPRTVRDDHPYLFQFPRGIPELLLPKIKAEPFDSSDHGAKTSTSTEQTVGKSEDTSSGSALTSPKYPSAGGYVGKLRVRKSGIGELDWGGFPLDVSPALKVHYHQEVVRLNITPEQERVVEEDGGEAHSLGRLKGKYVVKLNLDELLG